MEHSDNPSWGINRTFAGDLIGGPSPSRPAAPFWEYLGMAVAEDADIGIVGVMSMRFPVHYDGGVETSASILELCDLYGLSADELVRFYESAAENGLVAWDGQARALRITASPTVMAEAYEALLDRRAG